MPGMNSGLTANNPTLIAAFRAALLHQGLIVLLIFAVVAIAWVSVREWLRPGKAPGPATPEPSWRQLLRIGFGLIWILDGLLQAQPDMPGGLPSQVIAPTAASSPGWVQHVVNWAGTAWSFHPIQAGASVVWIQIGIGVWLIAAPRGAWSRVAGVASVAWGLVVWVFGEAFGGIFAPGLSWLTGAPGAVLFYCAAGVLIALPERAWEGPRLGRTILASAGAFFAGMALLQAWPGRGFWQGTLHGHQGTLTSMVSSMASTPQPKLFAGWAASFESFTAGHGFAVNLFAVIALAALGTCFLVAAAGRAPRRLIQATVAATIVLCLADWVLIEDFGFFGGVGTDPNSMIPMLLVILAGFLALAPAGAAATAAAAEPAIPAGDVQLAVTGPAPAASPAPGPATTTAAAAAAASSATPAAATGGTGGPGGPAGSGTGGTGGTGGAGGPAAGPPGRPGRPGRPGWRGAPGRLTRAFGSASTRAVVAVWAVAIIILGTAPMAMAQANPNADSIIAQAIDGSAAPLNFAAPAFTLTDQDGRQVSLASLRGKVVLLTFLDPVCTTDCPTIAQEFRQTDHVLGARSHGVELVAIVANPLYRSLAYTRAFDAEQRLTTVPNWLYLTGSLGQLQQAWRNYAIAAQITPAGGMIAHSDVAYVIDAQGHTRTELDFDPGPGTATSVSSFAVELTQAAEAVMKS
jgi:cytochrome oxidase Cu insertion factor (SCO1/SenC/PrrC family)